MSIGVGHSPQTRSFRSSDDLHSRSAAEHIAGACVAPSVSKAHRASPSRPLYGLFKDLFLRKRPSFLASRRFAQENPTNALMANSGSSFEVTVFAQLLNFSTSKLLNFLPSPVSTFFKRAPVIPAESSGLEVLNYDVLREKAFTGNGVGFSLSSH
jgi:hypothetical protein